MIIKLYDILYESAASEEAQRRGLKSIGFGRYADPGTGKVVAKNKGGRLVAVRGATDDVGKKKVKHHSDIPWFQADTESDIPKISPAIRHKISMRIDRLAKATALAKKQGKDAPNVNLCQITVPGTNLYCDDNLGIPRDQMPQFKGTPAPGSPAERMPKNKSGEVDTEPLFRKMLKNKRVKTARTTIPSDQLKATQSELVGSKVAGMAQALGRYPNNAAINAPIYVSRDGYVIDGHHRWAAVTSAAIAAGKPANMRVNVIDLDAKDIIPLANRFAQQVGITTKQAANND